MNALTLAAFATFAVLALPGASAVISTGDQYAMVELVGDVFAPGAVDLRPLPILYLDDNGNLWQESNGVAGLQQDATEDEEGNDVPADTSFGGWSSVPTSLPPLPSF